MGGVTACRIVISRWLSWAIFGRWIMMCALAEMYQWRVRHALNLLFLDPRHCTEAAAWETVHAWPALAPTAVDEARRSGLI